MHFVAWTRAADRDALEEAAICFPLLFVGEDRREVLPHLQVDRRCVLFVFREQAYAMFEDYLDTFPVQREAPNT